MCERHSRPFGDSPDARIGLSLPQGRWPVSKGGASIGEVDASSSPTRSIRRFAYYSLSLTFSRVRRSILRSLGRANSARGSSRATPMFEEGRVTLKS